MFIRIALIIVLSGLIGTLQPVSAKTLEDVLKEKGVITEEDYKKIVKTRPVTYKMGKGITLTSPDGLNALTIGGQIQPQYDYLDRDEGQNSSKFELKRVKLWVEGHAFTKDLTYKLQMRISNIQGGSTKNGGLMEEASMTYRLRDDLGVRLGQTKMRFGRQGIVSSKVMHLVDKSSVTKAFFPTYDTGLMLLGKVANGLVNYEGFVAGGAGQNSWSKNNRAAWNARVSFNPLGDVKYTEGGLEFSDTPLVSFAANYYQNKLDPNELAYGSANHLGFLKPRVGWFAIGNSLSAAPDQISAETTQFDMYGVDMAFQWRSLWLQAEYMKGEADGESSNNELEAEGFYLQGSYFLIPKKLSLGYRFSELDPNKDISNDKLVENTVGVSWYVKGHSLKVQADYTLISKESALARSTGDTDDKLLRLQVNLLF